MYKILVTTDYSAASKAGIRFAIQLASQTEAELIFLHCFSALIPTTIHAREIEEALSKQSIEHQKTVEKIVYQIYTQMNVRPGLHGFAALDSGDYKRTIIDYAETNGFDFICMSTRGAGFLKRFIGTHTSYIALNSSVPVIAIPANYRVKPITSILFASDLADFDHEMNRIATLAAGINAKIDLCHFYYPGQIALDKETLSAMWKKKHKPLDNVYLELYDLDTPFVKQLNELIQKIKPSVITFFTHARNTWYDKLFDISVTEAYTYEIKKPLLAFRKGDYNNLN
jgi:nucleotide-binding universal stress UspA family protein